jgi:hypothetical protein
MIKQIAVSLGGRDKIGKDSMLFSQDIVTDSLLYRYSKLKIEQ